MAATSEPPLISTSEFARRTRLSTKALRIYHQVGLLRPAIVEANGYRRYDPSQIRTGQLIGLLRGADVSLDEIALIIEDLKIGLDAAVQRLEVLLAASERQHTSRKLLIRHVQATLREEGHPMFTIKTRQVPARRLMSIQRRLRVPEIDGFAHEAQAAFAEHLKDAEPTGPFTLIYHAEISAESDGPLEAVLGCPDRVQPTEMIGVRTEPAHDEAYTTITKAQWQYPAILAAYDAVGRSPKVAERPNSRLSCREVYLADPDQIEEDDLICDVAFPLSMIDEKPQSRVGQ